MRKLLIVRNDRLGDWVLTLPLVEAIKGAWPACRIDAMAAAAVTPLLVRHGAIDEVLPSPAGRLGGVAAAARRIRAGRYDAAVVVHPDLADTLAVWLAGVKVRVGNAYRGYSPLYNRRARFHRGPSTRHEIEYNLHYLEPLGLAPATARPPRLKAAVDDRARAAVVLARHGVPPAGYIVVHPGSGGSSLNWPRERYRALVLELARMAGVPVVVTGSPAEAELAAYVAGEGAGRVSVAGDTDLGTLMGVLAGARLFISGNTGPMHVAAALGTPTVSLFTPLRSGAPARWGPRGNVGEVIVPSGVTCERCDREHCPHFNCMEAITLEEVLAAARRVSALGAK